MLIKNYTIKCGLEWGFFMRCRFYIMKCNFYRRKAAGLKLDKNKRG
jgi:hypothetical protein